MGGYGSGGQNRKSAALKTLEGNPGKRLESPEEKPKSSSERFSCPRFLDAIARKEWRRVYPELAKAGVLTKRDRGILAGYCSSYSTWIRAQEVLNKEGFTQLARHGTTSRPEVAIARDALSQMKSLATELGLSPRSRNGVKAAGTRKIEPEDPMEKALGTPLRRN